LVNTNRRSSVFRSSKLKENPDHKETLMTYDLDFKQMTPEEDSEFNLPWHYRDDDVAVGITGKALRFLIENREMYEYELKTVLHSA